jgi:peptidyl-tRNA hydrolase
MKKLKIVSWNVAHLDRLAKETLNRVETTRRDAVVREIRDLAPDILCLIEGPKGEAGIDKVAG